MQTEVKVSPHRRSILRITYIDTLLPVLAQSFTMAQLLQGKVAAITGGVTGIGRAIAIEYHRQAARVAVNYLDDDASRSHAATLRSEMGSPGDDYLFEYPGDISEASTARHFIDATASHFGNALDVVVCNAGIARFHDFLSSPDTLIEDHVRVNVQGT